MAQLIATIVITIALVIGYNKGLKYLEEKDLHEKEGSQKTPKDIALETLIKVQGARLRIFSIGCIIYSPLAIIQGAYYILNPDNDLSKVVGPGLIVMGIIFGLLSWRFGRTSKIYLQGRAY